MTTIQKQHTFLTDLSLLSTVVVRNPSPRIRLFGTTTKAAVMRSTTSLLLALLKRDARAFLLNAAQTAAVMKATTSRLLALNQLPQRKQMPQRKQSAAQTAAVMKATTSRLLALNQLPQRKQSAS
jgi:hypothetical protein